MGRGKREKFFFHFGQGKSGKSGNLVMVRVEVAFSCCRSGKEFHFSPSKKYFYLYLSLACIKLGI